MKFFAAVALAHLLVVHGFVLQQDKDLRPLPTQSSETALNVAAEIASSDMKPRKTREVSVVHRQCSVGYCLLQRHESPSSGVIVLL